MPRRRSLLFGSVVGLLAASGGVLLYRRRSGPVFEPDNEVCVVAPTFAYDPSSGLPPMAAREVPAQARCPVCGMFPARNRNWAAQVIFQDGHVQYLDSPLSLFHYLQQVPRYTPGRRAAEIAAIYVSDLGSGQWLDADQALYVHGSSMLGPMRSGNLPAFASQAQARTFISQKGGGIMSAAELRKGLPESLQQMAPHHHDGARP